MKSLLVSYKKLSSGYFNTDMFIDFQFHYEGKQYDIFLNVISTFNNHRDENFFSLNPDWWKFHWSHLLNLLFPP
jgi:hypothetical protein